MNTSPVSVDVVNLFSKIARKVDAEAKLESVARDSKFSALGIDSISMMEIIGEMEDELDIKLSDDRLAQIQTVGDMERVVLERLGARIH